MNAVQAGDPMRLEMVSDSFVCRQHELFNQAMGEIAFGARNGLHQSEFIELDHWLGHIKID